MAEIRAVSLDVGWTLAYPTKSMWEIFADLCNEAGAVTTAEKCEGLVRALWRMGEKNAEDHFRSGAQYEDSDDSFRGQFNQLGMIVFSQLGLDTDHSEIMEQFYERFWNLADWRIFPDVLAGIRGLRDQGVRVGVLSNAPSDMKQLLEHLGILPLLDFCVISAVERTKKPDRRIFETTVARAGVPAENVVHVGDMYLEDILGGGAAGIQTLLMERGRNALFPSFPESEGRPIDSSRVVKDLGGVLALLRQ